MPLEGTEERYGGGGFLGGGARGMRRPGGWGTMADRFSPGMEEGAGSTGGGEWGAIKGMPPPAEGMGAGGVPSFSAAPAPAVDLSAPPLAPLAPPAAPIGRGQGPMAMPSRMSSPAPLAAPGPMQGNIGSAMRGAGQMSPGGFAGNFRRGGQPPNQGQAPYENPGDRRARISQEAKAARRGGGRV
ncbi:hypothetical protein LCGC14_0478220 [marine sediment metagenome]|uniref:Uncharacterized protein n=1 Tax=marine sediment metagenome TaxID=412755 RepID=A0A0F9ST74_9ZZZZ